MTSEEKQKQIIEYRKKIVEDCLSGTHENYKKPVLDIILDKKTFGERFGRGIKTKTLVLGSLLYVMTEKENEKIRAAVRKLPSCALDSREQVRHPYRPYLYAWKVLKKTL